MRKRKKLLLFLITVLVLIATAVALCACGEEENDGTMFTVTLKSGYNDDSTSVQVAYGANYALPENPFTRAGYDFTGWTKEGSSFLLSPGAVSPIYVDTVYVANWQKSDSETPQEPEDPDDPDDPGTPEVPDSVTLTLSAGFGDETQSITLDKGEEYVLPENPFVREGYIFDGWSYGGETLAPGEKITVDASVTVTALWREMTYTVTFISDDEPVSVMTDKKKGEFVYSPAAPVKTGYDFCGWQAVNSSGEPTGEPVATGSAINVTGDLTFEAVWEILTYEITFEISVQTPFGKIDMEKETLTVEYNAIPQTTLVIPESRYIDNETMASFSGSWTPEVTAATADAVYSAEYTITDRLYPVEFIQNGYVFFEVDGEIVTEYGVKYRTDLEFKLVRSPGVYIDNVTVLANDELVSADPNGVYTLEWSADSIVSAANWEFAEYEIAVSAADAQYEISQTTGLHYGDKVTLTAWGEEWYNAGAPEVLLDGETLSPIAENEGKYVYEITATRNSSLEISGVVAVVPVIFEDIYGVEHVLDWTISDGSIGEKLPASIDTEIDLGADAYNVFLQFDYDYPGWTDVNPDISKMYAFTTSKNGVLNVVSEEEAVQNAVEHLKNPIYPTVGGENKYYILYSYQEYFSSGTPAHSFSIVVPENVSTAQYIVVRNGEVVQYGINTDAWSQPDWFEYIGRSSEGHPNLIGFIYKAYGDNAMADQIFDRELTLTGTEDIYIKITFEDGTTELPVLVNSKDKSIEVSGAYYQVPVGGGQYEETYCYKIDANYADMEYVPKYDTLYPVDVSFAYEANNSAFTLKEQSGTTVSGDSKFKFAAETDFIFTISYKTNVVDTAAMFDADNGYQHKIEILKISGEYDSVVYSYGETSSTFDVTVTIYGVAAGVTITDIVVVEKEEVEEPVEEVTYYYLPLEIGDYYDYYVDGVLVEGEVGTIVRAPIVSGSVVEMRLHDEVPYNFVLIQGATAKVYYSYEHINGQVVVEDIYGGSLESRKISYTFSSTKVKFISEFKIDVPFEFRQYEFGYSAEHLESISAEQDGTITILNDDSDPYVDYQNGFVLEVVAPNGTVPVLYVERADMLSDSFRKYYASDKKLQEGEQYMYVYTFTLTDIDSEIRWYLGTEAEVYDITFVYGDSSVIIPVEYGTSINDIADVPTYYVAADDGGQTFYMITAWMNGDTEVSVIDGSVTTLHASGTATDATVSFSYSGGVEFFDNLAAALASDIVKNNSGTLDMFYGKPDGSLTEGTYTIPAGVTLRLPYAVGSYGRAYGVTGADGNSPSVFFADESDGFTSVVIGAGATLEVYGSVSVGGIVGYPASAMPYQGQTSAAHAVLELDGTMNVYSGGRLYVNGYIEGSGTVELETGAASYLPFVVKDYRGGTNSSNVYMEDIAPFNIYEMPNIQTTYIINYGASEYAYAMLYAMNTFNETVAQVIGDEGMIRLGDSADGYVLKNTRRISNPRYTGSNSSVEPEYEYRTELDIYGGGSDGVLSLSILGLVTVTTGDVYMGIPYTYERITLHDGEYTIHNMFKIMPGSTLEVASDATLEILAGASIAVYEEGFKETSSQLNNRQQLTYPAEPNGYAEGGKLALGGTLTITGSFGGEITAEDASGTPTIVVNTSSNASLSVEAVEAVQLNNAEFEYTYQATLIAMAGETQLAPCPPGAPVTYLYSDGVWAIS